MAHEGSVVVFGPSPLLEVSIEQHPSGSDRIRVLAGGQPVWVARMAATMGSAVTMCGLSGGRMGSMLDPLLAVEPFDRRLVASSASTGVFVVDQRQEPAREVASQWAPPPSAGEVDALVRATLAAARPADVLVVCNPMPGDALPLPVYATLVRSAVAAGLLVVVDLSTPRLDAALGGGPAVVKINDWELAEVVVAPVDELRQRDAAARRLVEMGASGVVVTRGPSSVLAVDETGAAVELVPPPVGPGRAAGCGDAMTGAMSSALAQGLPWLDAVRLGMAAGTAHYRGRGESSRAQVESLADDVSLRPVRP
jgi:fructose-1-phosphate kinase PfkB-like protein